MTAFNTVRFRVKTGREQEFLDAHAATMPRVTVRYAVEKLEPSVRARYLTRGRQ